MQRQPHRHMAQITGRNLRAARDERDLTQRTVAEAIGVTPMDVSRWETGRVEPGGKYRQALADFFFDGNVAALYREPEDIVA